MRFYTTDKLGPRRTLTPEGFLICHDASIARSGEQVYAADELPGLQAVNGQIIAIRDEVDVFRQETMSSFEGKPVVNDHPMNGENVGPDNWRQLAVGHTQNVRRGVGDSSDLLIADIVVTDRRAIQAIMDGKRELSAGYDMNVIVLAPGRVRMKDITGNHVALVNLGRCGARCSIGDSTMNLTLADRVRRAFGARDNDQLEAALSDMPAEPGGGGNDPKADGSGDGATHIHVHVKGESKEGGEVGAKTTEKNSMPDDPAEPEGMVERIARLESMVTALMAKLSGDAGGGDEPVELDSDSDEGGDDPGYDDPNSPDGPDTDEDSDDKTKVVDSKTIKLRDAWRDTTSRAEILIPGIRIPVFDSQSTPELSTKRLCAFRRRTMMSALSGTSPTAAVIRGANVTGLNIRDAGCDAVGMLFIAASNAVRDSNNVMVGRISARDSGGRKGPPTNAEMNVTHRDFWKTQKTGFARRPTV